MSDEPEFKIDVVPPAKSPLVGIFIGGPKDGTTAAMPSPMGRSITIPIYRDAMSDCFDSATYFIVKMSKRYALVFDEDSSSPYWLNKDAQ